MDVDAVVNLNRARKARARAAAKATAAGNRISFGRTRIEKACATAETARRDRLHAGRRITKPEA